MDKLGGKCTRRAIEMDPVISWFGRGCSKVGQKVVKKGVSK